MAVPRWCVVATTAVLVGSVAACGSAGPSSPSGAPGPLSTRTVATSVAAPATSATPAPAPSTTTPSPTTSPSPVTTPGPSTIAGYPPGNGQLVEPLAHDVMRWVYEPYRRWAFTGVRVPVIGDCLRTSCAFPVDDLVSAPLRARLRSEASATYDPFICRAEPMEVLVDNPVADDRAPLSLVSLSGDASEANGGTNRVTMVIERSSGMLVDVVCSEDPLPVDQRPPLPVSSGTRHTVAEALELLCAVYNWVPAAEPPYVPRSCDEISWRRCGGRTVGAVLSPEMQARQDATEGYSIVTCCQNTSATEARGAATLLGGRLAVELRTHWGGPPIVATVDLDSLVIVDIVCPAPVDPA